MASMRRTTNPSHLITKSGEISTPATIPMEPTSKFTQVSGDKVSFGTDFEKKKSSYKGHRVDALVLEGDEGRDKLR